TVTAALNLLSVARLAGGTGFAAGELVRPVAASLIMVVAVLGARRFLGAHLGLFLTTVGAAAVGAVVYGLALLLVGGVKAADLELVPGLARRVLPHLRRWGLIRD